MNDLNIDLKTVCEIIGINPEINGVSQQEAKVLFNKVVCGISVPRVKADNGYIYFSDIETCMFQKDKDDEYARKAINDGAMVIFARDKIVGKNGESLPCIIVNDPVECMVKLCSWIRKKYENVKSIAITGTCGKTTTKEFIVKVLETKYSVFTNGGNDNDRVEVCRYIQKLKEKYDIYVQEAGAAFPGMVESSAKMLMPNACVITNIGNYHMDLYKTHQKLVEDKISLAKSIPKDGLVVLNMDDENLRNIETQAQKFYISEKDSEADCFISEVNQEKDKVRVKFVDNRMGGVSLA